MVLGTGARIGSYEIVGVIGAGGMGEVYRARDTKLNRDVAIKVLPELFAADPDRLARFEREAQAVAALSHPNVLAIHDYGVDGTRAYAVMELLDGETLREQLTHGPLPSRRAIEYGVQIARGLAAAHDKGIVHRDLKPENVIVTTDGIVKILDFGLARRDSGIVDSSSATIQQDTTPGSVLGTFGYMSPEQVRGEPVDPRSDLFSLGSVFYEMLTGRRAFQRDTTAETMTAILRDDPPELAQSRADLPPALDRIVRHCLEKNRQQRFQTARDVAFALEALSGTSVTTVAAVPPVRRRWSRVAAAVAVIAAVLVAGIAVGRRTAPAPAVAFPSFEAKTFDPQAIFAARFAPDGRTIVFSAARQGNETELFVSREGATIPQPLGLRRTQLLSISSKGELAVLSNATFITHRLFDGTLSRMPIDGTPRPWIEHVREADWSPDGNTLAIVRVAGSKDQLEYPIGTKLYETTGYVSDLRVSPDGTHVAFMDHQNRFDNRGWVKVVDRAGTMQTLAGEYWGEEGLSWSTDGRDVLYSAADLAGDYQPHVASASGSPNPHVILRTIGAAVLLDVRDDRWILLRDDERFEIRALFAGAAEERVIGYLGVSLSPLLSRDGKVLAFDDESQSAGANYAVMMTKAEGDGVVRVGDGMLYDVSSDGSRVLAGTYTPAAIRVYPTGAGEPQTLNLPALKTPAGAQFFPDGRRILACGDELSGGRQCYVVDGAAGTPKPAMPRGVIGGLISPDGERAIVSTPDGAFATFAFRDGRLDLVPIRPDEKVVQWSPDGQSVLVFKQTEIPSRLERVDLASGKRTLVRELGPPDRAGIMQLVGATVARDGGAYAYGYWKRSSKLILATQAAR